MNIEQIQNVLQKYIDIINGKQTRHNFVMPSIEILELGKVAGDANGHQGHGDGGRVRFNKTLLAENEQEFIDTIIPHEFAHIVVHKMYGSGPRAHGKEFKNVMRHFGANESTYHNMDVDNALRNAGKPARSKTRPMVWECPVCGHHHSMTTTMHNKMIRGSKRWCRCPQPIKYAPENALIFSHNALTIPTPEKKVVEVVEDKKQDGTAEEYALNFLVRKYAEYGVVRKTPAKKKHYVAFSVNVGRIQVSYNSRNGLYSVLVYVSKDLELESIVALTGRDGTNEKMNEKHHYVNFSNMKASELDALCPKRG